MNTDPIRALADTWRKEASILRKRGVISNAETLASCASELETGLREWALEELDLVQASEESGYSYSRLQRLVSGGGVANAGEPGAPRIRRKDLPRRPSNRVEGNGPDLAAQVLRARSGR